MASIVKRKNRYSVVYTYKDDDGNQHQKWETFDTNADAKKRKTQIEFEQQSGTFIIPNATTVADLLEEYCSVYGVNNWAMSTYRSKKGLMYNYIIPLIGDGQSTKWRCSRQILLIRLLLIVNWVGRKK